MVKILLAMKETWVQSLDWKDPLEKGTATPSSVLAWRMPQREEPSMLQSMGLPRFGYDRVIYTHTALRVNFLSIPRDGFSVCLLFA